MGEGQSQGAVTKTKDRTEPDGWSWLNHSLFLVNACLLSQPGTSHRNEVDNLSRSEFLLKRLIFGTGPRSAVTNKNDSWLK